MSHIDEPASTTPPPSTRNPVRRRDAILDAMYRYHRAVGAVVAATAALTLNGALLSGFDTKARRATQTEVAGQKARQGVEAAQQTTVQKREVRVVELPPVQIVGRRLPPDTQMATQESLPAGTPSATVATTASTIAAAPEPAAFAPLTAEVPISPHNAGQVFTASRVGLLPNAPLEQKPSLSSWASTQR